MELNSFRLLHSAFRILPSAFCLSPSLPYAAIADRPARQVVADRVQVGPTAWRSLNQYGREPDLGAGGEGLGNVTWTGSCGVVPLEVPRGHVRRGRGADEAEDARPADAAAACRGATARRRRAGGSSPSGRRTRSRRRSARWPGRGDGVGVARMLSPGRGSWAFVTVGVAVMTFAKLTEDAFKSFRAASFACTATGVRVAGVVAADNRWRSWSRGPCSW